MNEMRGNDSRECRSCHDGKAMNTDKQSIIAAEAHAEGKDAEMTCVDCHDGIAHKAADDG